LPHNLKLKVFNKYITNNKIDKRKIVTGQDAEIVLDIFQIRDFLTEVAEGNYQIHNDKGEYNHYANGYCMSIVEKFDYLNGLDIPHSEKNQIADYCKKLWWDSVTAEYNKFNESV
tara:strand:+ start:114 stop:458 length:345 start_codon:yes stop_codon:yes gene_type:complete